ncbi:MAG: sugar phosphate isomerase/epimerase [Planctomycetes bacterium]|nr:sugar phosphate isomerase/epimerase [Planctomycetota bacterium]
MQFGVIHYNTPGDTLEAFLDYAAQTGFDAVELFSGDVWGTKVENPEREAERVRKLVESRGLSISALGAGNDFVLLDSDAISQQVERMSRICRLARIAGTSVIRTEGGRRKPEVPQAKECEAMAECLKRCRDFIERDEVYLAVDNHGHVTNDGDLQARLFRLVGSPFVGANLDTMNYRWMGHAVETCDRFYDLMAPYTFHTHMKDGRGSQKEYVGEALGEGEIHLLHALRALKRSGYRGVFCSEWEGRGDKGAGYAKCLAWLKANVKA